MHSSDARTDHELHNTHDDLLFVLRNTTSIGMLGKGARMRQCTCCFKDSHAYKVHILLHSLLYLPNLFFLELADEETLGDLSSNKETTAIHNGKENVILSPQLRSRVGSWECYLELNVDDAKMRNVCCWNHSLNIL